MAKSRKKKPPPRAKAPKRKPKPLPNEVTPRGGRVQTAPETIDDRLKQIRRVDD